MTSSNLRPFEEGNDAAVKHGVYSLAVIEPRAEQLAAAWRPHVPRYTERLEPLLSLAALIAARVERAHGYLAQVGDWDDDGELNPIHARLSTWEAELRRQLAALGLTNTATLGVAGVADLARQLAAIEEEAVADG